MSFVKLQPENFDTFSLTLRPRAEFVSSSSGITGSVRLIERPSTFNKEIITSFERSTYREGLGELDDLLERAATVGDDSDRASYIESYLARVNNQKENQKNNIVIPVQRITQSIDFDRNSFIKSNIKNVLMPQYNSVYTDCSYSYKNYHTINFFTGSNVASDSVIIYPNISGAYTLTDQFTFDFYINPRYLHDSGAEFNAGTILHMSSSFCLSLMTGSHKNSDGKVDQFRLALALKHSANVPPSSVDVTIPNGTRSYPQDLIYVSNDNMLKHNHWHHVTVRWGSRANNSSGSFEVDSLISTFHYPSSSLVDGIIPQVLFMGNQCLGPQDTRYFFDSTAVNNYGVEPMLTFPSPPLTFTFNSPLNA